MMDNGTGLIIGNLICINNNLKCTEKKICINMCWTIVIARDSKCTKNLCTLKTWPANNFLSFIVTNKQPFLDELSWNIFCLTCIFADSIPYYRICSLDGGVDITMSITLWFEPNCYLFFSNTFCILTTRYTILFHEKLH